MGEWLDFTDEVVTVNGKGEEIKREKVTNRGYKYFLSKKTFLEMISIPSGQYLIGAPKSELGWKLSQSPQSLVNVQAFCLSRYPITQRQWREVAKLEPVNIELNPYPAHFEGYDRPVEQINWWEAEEFCDRLSRLTGLNYRLPAEKEWE
ncbi:MAG: formylglycine-generating enzyme family protein, partial [Microcystis sp. M49629_WE12]|nr:formylglycine-generating enzyme family protein [Microcystis sp. M49629_WE12]